MLPSRTKWECGLSEVKLSAYLVRVEEEHQHTPLLLHTSKSLTAVASDVPDTGRGDIDYSHIRARFNVHVNRPGELEMIVNRAIGFLAMENEETKG